MAIELEEAVGSPRPLLVVLDPLPRQAQRRTGPDAEPDPEEDEQPAPGDGPGSGIPKVLLQ